MIWTPHVTVATVIEKDGLFLMVHENSDYGDVFNQPAGHLDPNESLVDAAIRETREETGWKVKISNVLTLSLYNAPDGLTYFRTTFVGKAIEQLPDAKLDKEIIEAVWLSYEEILENKHKLRSPMVLADIERYRKQEFYSLDLLSQYPIKSL